MNLNTYLFLLFVLFYCNGGAQLIKACEPTSCELVYDSALNRSYYLHADISPNYRGGMDTLFKVIGRNLKWPNGDCCISGKVYVSFIVEPDGLMSNKRILRSIGSDSLICNFNRAVLDMLDSLTDWNAGKCDGKSVPVLVSFPINITLK